MAQVPNYYYNSPWLADVGRNLASALAPPDQDKLLAREHVRLQMENERTKAANEITDRENMERARGAIGKLYALQSSPILGADGKPDKGATEAEAYRLADEAMTYGPKDVRAEVDDALFNLSPKFRAKRVLQAYAQNAQADRLGRSLAGALDQINLRGRIQGGLQDDQQAFELDRLDKLYGLRMKELDVKNAAAAKKAGQPPLTISKQLGEAIWRGILQREKATKHPLTDEARFALFSAITQDTQATRDPYASTQNLWNLKFPQNKYTEAATQEVPETDSDFGLNNLMRLLGIEPTDTYLAPGPDAPAAPTPEAPAVDPNSLGAAAITPPPLLTPNDRIRIEGDMTRASNERAAAETAAMPVPAAKPATPNKPASKGKAPTKTINGRTLPAPRSKEERDSLPPNTEYFDPKGVVRKTRGA